MKEKDILGQVINTPDDKMRDDDHLERPELSKKDAAIGFRQLVEKHKNDKFTRPKSDEFAQGIIDALNKDKSNY